ncbi:BLUF domain-containing protein [Acinetobacter sp.]|jgi:hypothetical protein|uniref:BLUF domain-containing protein n=1 Tax=Acinetobacter sp. TaxID=472 RepID=UPI00283812D1|nr:BLUF domain-containing protein [Acinetobacter sp.]MDR0237304.1 BLUF domain-containing protein [Acinetobacter sp.]
MTFQLCYASKTTSPHHQVLNDLREILGEARDFNILHQLQGVLYFADEHFFQCLEGDESVILRLLEKLYKDPRHHHIKLFRALEIERGHFSQWSMKYVRRNSKIQQFFEHKGFLRFQPLNLDKQDIPNLLKILYEIEQPEDIV